MVFPVVSAVFVECILDLVMVTTEEKASPISRNDNDNVKDRR